METDAPVETLKKPKRKIEFNTLSSQPVKIADADQSAHRFNNTNTGKAWIYLRNLSYEKYTLTNQKLAESLDNLHDFVKKLPRTEKLLLIAAHIVTKSNPTSNSTEENELDCTTFYCNGWKANNPTNHPLIFRSTEFDQKCTTCDRTFYDHIKRYDGIGSTELNILVSAALDAHILKYAISENSASSVKQVFFAVYELIRNALSTDCGQRAQNLKLTGMPPFESPTLETIVRHELLEKIQNMDNDAWKPIHNHKFLEYVNDGLNLSTPEHMLAMSGKMLRS